MEAISLSTLLAIVIGVVYPTYALMNGKKTIEFLTKFPDKLPLVYRVTMITLIVLAGLIFTSLIYEKESINTIGLSFINNPLLVFLLFIVVVAVFWLLNAMKIPNDKHQKIEEGYKDVLHVMPSNQLQYKWSVMLSLVAGTLEEVIFRGFLYWQLTLYMHWIPAVILANVVFGLCHAATKIKNAINAGLLGLFFSALYLLTGTLWLSMLAHIIVDLYAMTMAVKLAKYKE